ncbi:MAG: hypothetical protein GQ575_02740 [Deltaproteobacteria bacterium]|nr:hypothetical protein [Deltaproteobacteria bacterium]
MPQIIIAPGPAKLIPKGGYGIWLCTKWMFLIVIIYYILYIFINDSIAKMNLAQNTLDLPVHSTQTGAGWEISGE